MSLRTLRLGVAVLAVLGTVRVGAGEIVDVTATDGVQLVAELDGSSGPGVVLVHGAGAARQAFAEVARTLAAGGFRALRLDLRGHGASEGTADAGAIARDVEGAYRYLLGRKIRPVFLIGAAAAGTASLVVASRLPVAGVITLSSPPAAPGVGGVPVLALGDERAPVAVDDETVLARVLAFLHKPTAPGTDGP